VLTQLKEWLEVKIRDKHVEPNEVAWARPSGYMLKHWQPLTLFLRQAGAPLDDNACERAFKMAILHRKNSLSYKTVKGARVGDLFMSLINTCRLNRINPFAYLLAIATHPAEVQAHPSAWLPWNYLQPDPAALHHDPPAHPG